MFMKSLKSVIAVLTATLCLGSAPASANPDLQQAKLALADLDYERAVQHLERALLWGRSSPAEVGEILRLSGEVQGALGDAKKAEQHFFEMLTLDPSAVLPTGRSPKITEPFARAKERVAESGGLAGTCQIDPAAPAVRVTISADPAQLVAGARAMYRIPDATGTPGSEQTVEARGRDSLTLALPAVDELQLYCALIDQHGNQLFAIGSPSELQTLILPERDDSKPGSQGKSQPIIKHWATWGAVSLATVGAGGYFALQVASAQDELDELNQNSGEHEFSEAKAIEDRGRRNALLANISLGVAGACAVVSIVQFVRRPRGESQNGRERASMVTPTLVPGGAGVAWTGRF